MRTRPPTPDASALQAEVDDYTERMRRAMVQCGHAMREAALDTVAATRIVKAFGRLAKKHVANPPTWDVAMRLEAIQNDG